MYRFFIFSFITLSLVNNTSFAQKQTYIREGTYQANDEDSKKTACGKALKNIQIELARQLGENIRQEQTINRREGNKDEYAQNIESTTAAYFQTTTLEEKWDGKTCYVKVKIEADPKKIMEEINNEKRLRDAQQKAKEAEKTIKLLQKQNEMVTAQLNDAIKNNSAGLKELQEKLSTLNNKITRENKTYQKAENELNAEEYFNKGYKAYENGNYNLAIQYLEKAIDIVPNNKYVQDLLQECLRQKSYGAARYGYNNEKVKPNMFSILGGFSAFNATSIEIEGNQKPFKLSGSGLPLLLGLSYRIGKNNFYITNNYRFLASKKDIFKRFRIENPASEDLEDLKVSYFSVDAHINYSFHQLLNINWLDIQLGIGLGYQKTAITYKVENEDEDENENVKLITSISGLYLNARLLQARILLSPHFFIFINNEISYAFLKQKVLSTPDGRTYSDEKARSFQYELSAGVAISF